MDTRRLMLLCAAGVIATAWVVQAQPLPGGTLDPTAVPKYVTPLVVPPVMPQAERPKDDGKGHDGKGRKDDGKGGHGDGKDHQDFDYYEIAVRQFQQQILPATDGAGADTGLGPTTVWSYTAEGHPETFNYPAFTIEAKVNRTVRVKWINGLVDEQGNFLPHLLAVDPTLHWANPPGPIDTRPEFSTTPGPYTGPVPIVTHLHEGHTPPESDGLPEAWYLPNAKNIPDGFSTRGSDFAQTAGVPLEPGAAVFEYPNDQRAATMWYHDHTLGMTRLNVYAGPAGFYLLRGGPEDLDLGYRAPRAGDSAKDNITYTEIPIAVQDRSFNADGSLFYPDTRAFFDQITGPYIPFTDIAPIWNPEFFGNTMVVNGRTWPTLNVEPRRYRLRFLDGCNSRFLILKIASDPLEPRPAAAALTFWQIGAEGGFLPAPVNREQLLLGPAERADVIVDFSGLAVGTELFLINEGPDEPFGGGLPVVDFPPADPSTTGQVMRFLVVAPNGRDKDKDGKDGDKGKDQDKNKCKGDCPDADQGDKDKDKDKDKGKDKTAPPAELVLPPFVPLGPEDNTRQLSLNEVLSESFPDAPVAALLGTVENGTPVPLGWEDPTTEVIQLNATEIWELYNYTVMPRPM